MKLVAGLGNPGGRYARTRHNAGYLVVDRLAERHGLRFRSDRQGSSCKLGSIVLFKPSTYMNASGRAVQGAAGKVGAKPAEILVIHDDLDMPLGKLRFKLGGGAGGQKGVKDTIELMGADFWRLKVGISRPPEGWRVENWVLSRFRDDEAALVDAVIEAAADAVEAALQDGFDEAMNDVNGLDLREAQGPPG